jgi:hypothetical protein
MGFVDPYLVISVRDSNGAKLEDSQASTLTQCSCTTAFARLQSMCITRVISIHVAAGSMRRRSVLCNRTCTRLDVW